MTTQTAQTITVTHSTLNEDDATGGGLVENTMDLEASNQRFNEMLQADIQGMYPDYSVTVTDGDVYSTTVYTTDDENQDDIEMTSLDAAGRIYGEGECWVEAGQ